MPDVRRRLGDLGEAAAARAKLGNPDFVAILDSQKAWATRIFPWADAINIPVPDKASYDARPK